MRLSHIIESTTEKTTLIRLRAKLRRLEAEFKDMNVSPSSQKVADAIDDARDEIAACKADIARLSEGAIGYDAATAYQKHVVEIKSLLDRIAQTVQERADADAPSWGGAGDLAQAASQLREVADFLSGNVK